jgi:hypothetical protein
MTTGTASQMQLRQSCFLLVHILGAQRCFGDGTGAAVRCGPAEQKVLGLASMLAHQKETGKRRPPPQSGRAGHVRLHCLLAAPVARAAQRAVVHAAALGARIQGLVSSRSICVTTSKLHESARVRSGAAHAENVLCRMIVVSWACKPREGGTDRSYGFICAC